ncbi:hypothetical protein [Methylobacterium flocculans]|uniref:hypothetical protein n=1 Tax=Methylobacterium flocculans TaxID=2984843 RepID=UPI0021F2CA88|nr:hypothetical protein [Methylobacterium sp. FF17]
MPAAIPPSCGQPGLPSAAAEGFHGKDALIVTVVTGRRLIVRSNALFKDRKTVTEGNLTA